MAHYFSDAKFSERNRALFAFASYNAGAEKIARMRTLAAQRGLDPDEWFNSGEIVASEKIGAETTTYSATSTSTTWRTGSPSNRGSSGQS